MPMFPAYGNLPIDLQCRSIGWFLYEGNIGMKKVKHKKTYDKCSKFNQIYPEGKSSGN